jgi:alpha-L-fucosidase
MTRRSFLMAAAASVPAAYAQSSSSTPAPFGVTPSSRQLGWTALEQYAFLHFTVNTFTDREWGNGDEDPKIFKPTDFNADAMVKALAAGGMKGVILTCKHHDGFCLWPTKTTEHSVRSSTWRGGKGDVVREVSEAAARNGLKFGVYLSPWDRNNAAYGKPEYIKIYRDQLRELLTGYGPIYEVWHDGANGGDGYYGGAREKRTIDKTSYYDWPNTWAMVRSLQPDAVIFSDVGPDIRWVGNESGYANETCWATYTPVGEKGDTPAPGYTRSEDGTTGTWGGKYWMPAECDVSIRPGWFWHEKENAKVKTPQDLMDLYYKSVGRGASFLLNVPPDRRGQLGEADVKSLAAFGRALKETFAENLAAKAKVTASNVRGGTQFPAANLVDGRPETFWATDDGVHSADVILETPRPVTFDLLRVRETIHLGQRIQRIALETWGEEDWEPVATATSVGSCRLIHLKRPVTASRIRLRVVEAAACPALTEVSLHRQAEIG